MQNILSFSNLFFGGLFIILLIFVLFIQLQISKIKKRQKELFSGTKGRDLEEVILKNQKRLSQAEQNIKELYEIAHKFQGVLRKSIKKVGIVRFNPFDNVGGNQSFSIALLDSKNNGIVITSLYSREGVRVYAKSILHRKSDHKLTDEEIQAIQAALENYKRTKSRSRPF